MLGNNLGENNHLLKVRLGAGMGDITCGCPQGMWFPEVTCPVSGQASREQSRFSRGLGNLALHGRYSGVSNPAKARLWWGGA
jgi:hypothetical protein